MRWQQELKTGLSPLVDLIYPPRCPSCGVAVAAHGGLCVDCWSQLDLLEANASDMGDASAVIAACAYGEVSRQLVLNFKHGGKTALATVLAPMMAVSLPDASEEDPPLLIPVPLHRMRLWERGYNQAGLLARELAKLGKGQALLDGLVRTKRTPSLGSLGKEERAAVLQDAIEVPKGKQARIACRDVRLVDDVYTSGATSTACTKALLNAGAKSVTTVCFARVID